jgi:hypothetical protein
MMASTELCAKQATRPGAHSS